MLAGDEQAFEAFFNAYFARVYRFALAAAERGRRSGPGSRVSRRWPRPCAASATSAANRRSSRGSARSAAGRSWTTSASNRRHTRHVVLIDDRPDLRAAIDAIEAPEEFDLVKSYGRAEAGRLVRVVLDRLPANYGDALEWKYMEGELGRGNRRAARHRHDRRPVPARPGAHRVPRSAGTGIRRRSRGHCRGPRRMRIEP